MVDESREVVLSKRLNPAGLIAGKVTVRKRLRETRLEPHGVKVLRVSDSEEALIGTVIDDVSERRCLTSIHEVIRSLENRGAKVVILGCTKLLPIAFKSVLTRRPPIDCLGMLAKAVAWKAKFSRVE